MKNTQVVIVGGGPVGVGLALELGLRGIRCVLVERHTKIQRIPKGQNLTQRTLEHFQFWGVVDGIRAARVMPPGVPASGINAYGSLMGEYWAAPSQRELVQEYYFQKNERLPQYCTEEVLRSKLATLSNVETLWGWNADRIEQDAQGVQVNISERAGAGKRVLNADYVVGCDGGHSVVRDQIGIARSGSDFDQKMVLAVFRSKELHEGLKRFPTRSTYNVMHPELKGYWMFFGRIDVGEGFFFHAPVPVDSTAENYDFLGLLHKAAGFKFACEFDHLGFWDLRVAVAEQYQVGRAFIAGDAAHSHPPYGGFGLNNGLEDARNLGWKLAASLQGWGSDALLASYSEERRPIFKETGEDFIAARIATDAEFLERYSPERDRSAFEAAWKKRIEGVGGRAQVYEPHYEGSSVIVGPPGGRCSAHGTHTHTARAGHHLPPARLSNGQDVYEVLDTGFNLLAFGVDDSMAKAFESAARERGVPLKLIRDTYEDVRADYGAHLTLLRPDHYVVWCGNAPLTSPGAILDRALGR